MELIALMNLSSVYVFDDYIFFVTGGAFSAFAI